MDMMECVARQFRNKEQEERTMDAAYGLLPESMRPQMSPTKQSATSNLPLEAEEFIMKRFTQVK